MASRRQRDEWTALARQQAAEVRGWFMRLLNLLLMKLPSARVLYAIGMPVALFAFVSAVAWPLMHVFSARTDGSQLATTEFPLGDPTDVAVDSRGRFYVVDSFHRRVQRYSRDGEFERGWFVTKNAFTVRTTADDRVIVGDENGPRTYSSDGELLEVNSDENELQRSTQPTGPYAVRRGLLPHVVDTQTGLTVIATPWPLRLIATPFPVFAYFLIGVAFVGLGDLRRRRERQSALAS